jgi:IS30 family transposase
MRDYTQLTEEERYQTEALLKMWHHQSEIAVVLKRHKSTISREVRRNRGLRGYRPKQAQRLALALRSSSPRRRCAGAASA